MKQLVFFISLLLYANFCNAQSDILNRVNTVGQRGGSSSSRKDTIGFQHRDDLKDSITITYRYLDSTARHRLDSSVNDFDKYYSVPSTYQYLGNNGAAAVPLVFEPYAKAGWDAGFHAYDIYRFRLEDTKLYKTTKPFSMLSYQLASGKEQMLKAFHTQNPRPNLNVGFDYRLISAPGFFVTQNTSHNNTRFFTTYQGKRKRYNANLILVNNVIRASENGGIQNDSSLQDPNKKQRYSVAVNLGNAASYATNPFLTTIATGNIYKDFTAMFRQSYDLGKHDSLVVNDSTTEYLFYPKLRIQHTVTYRSYKYDFRDVGADSALYKNWYNIDLPTAIDTFSIGERWRVLSNDLSLYQFPDTKNAAQFFLAGATVQNIKGTLPAGRETFYNILLHGEYRNRTRNKLWDVLLKGEFYLNGLNAGNYSAYATLSRYLNRKLGDINIFFRNVNRTPSFIFDDRSGFHLDANKNFNKENITTFGAKAVNPYFELSFTNHLLTNYTYFTNYYQTAQYNKIINIIQMSASKKIRLTKHVNYYGDVTVQQVDEDAPVKVPFVFTRSRIAFEGNFYKNLNLSTGLEIRYYTPYHAYNYSPLNGQFVPQDTATISNRPDIAAFLNFRIKGFTAYIRAENLNTISLNGGFSFTNNNFAAPHYPTPGLILRFGIQWWFVN